jgi:hypothetical protein
LSAVELDPVYVIICFSLPSGQVVTNYWKAVIGYKFNRQKIRVDDIIQNPLGIEIIDYKSVNTWRGSSTHYLKTFQVGRMMDGQTNNCFIY